MSRWLQAARACEPRSGSILTKDKTDTTDKTPCNPPTGEVLSVPDSLLTDKTPHDFMSGNSRLDVSSVLSVLSGGVRSENPPGEVLSVGVSSVPSPSRQDYPPGAIVHLARYRPKLDRDGRPVRQLPTHPATCAICGVADWFVCMTDTQGRALHVCCWKAEGGTS